MTQISPLLCPQAPARFLCLRWQIFLFKRRWDQGSVGKFLQNIKPMLVPPSVVRAVSRPMFSLLIFQPWWNGKSSKNNYFCFWRIHILLSLCFNSCLNTLLSFTLPRVCFRQKLLFWLMLSKRRLRGDWRWGGEKKRKRMKSRTDSHLMWLEIKP